MGGIGLRFLSPPVAGTMAAMIFVYWATVFVFVDKWLSLRSSPGILNALAFSWVALTCAVSFFAAAVKDPGRVPPSFAPEVEGAQKDTIHSRYCDKCCCYKPPRTHHCRVCKRCVLKMDHHCMWISNCVGYANYKAFLICVFNAAIGSLYSMVIFAITVTQKDQDFRNIYDKLFYIFSGSLFAVLSFITTTLLGWHICLLAHNKTTIEYRECVRAQWLAKKRGQQYHHPFDVGIYKNVISVLGPNVLLWLCPIAVGHLKDGTDFPMSMSSE